MNEQQTPDQGYSTEYEEAVEEWREAHPAPAVDASEAEWETYMAAEDAQIKQAWAAEDALRARYAATYKAYADAFTAAVLDEASTIGLSVPVEVKTQTDPEASWGSPADTTNPDDYGSDALAWRLWSAARARVPAPSVLIDTPIEPIE